MNQINLRDLFNKKFSSGFRGYDKSQVENHIQTLSREFEILENKILDLEDKVKVQKTENDKFKSVESSLIITLKTAEDTAKGILEKAKEDAKGILDDAREELSGIKHEYEKIMSLRDSTIKDIGDLKEKINLGLDEIGLEANFNEIEKSIDAVEQNIDSDDITEPIQDQKTISNDENIKGLEEELFTEESLDLNLEEDKIDNDNQEIILESIDPDEVDEKNDEEIEETKEEPDLDNNEDNQEPSDLFSDDEKEKNDEEIEETKEESDLDNIEDNQEPSDLFSDDEEKNDNEDQYELVTENEEPSDLFLVDEDNQKENEEIISDRKEMSADDIFGGEKVDDTNEIIEDEESIEEKEESSESLEEETPDDRLDSEKKEVTPDKKKSDNVQKSFFDTFDENQ